MHTNAMGIRVRDLPFFTRLNYRFLLIPLPAEDKTTLVEYLKTR